MTAFLIKVLAIAAISASFALVFMPQKSEYSYILSLAGGALILIIILESVMPSVIRLKSVFENSGGISGYFSLALKALGIAYLAGFVSDTCRDFGQSALASKAELAGKCAIFILCIPEALSVLEVALKFVKI